MKDLHKQMLKEGAITKYHKTSVLNEDISWFENNRFEIIQINCRKFNKNNFHKHIKEALNFPDYYGENMSAFDDCISDLGDKKYRGLVIVFNHFDDFYNDNKSLALRIIDSIARESWYRLVDGNYLLGLVQSSDPWLEIESVGGSLPQWNSNEWFNENRIQ